MFQCLRRTPENITIETKKETNEPREGDSFLRTHNVHFLVFLQISHQAEVTDLDSLLVRCEEDVPGGQVPVDTVLFLQIAHGLNKRKT